MQYISHCPHCGKKLRKEKPGREPEPLTKEYVDQVVEVYHKLKSVKKTSKVVGSSRRKVKLALEERGVPLYEYVLVSGQGMKLRSTVEDAGRSSSEEGC